MEFTFRWYGQEDPVTLPQIRQIPYVQGIVSSLGHIPIGDAWPLADILQLKRDVESTGLKLSVIESVPVHEDIKLGLPTRDVYISNYITTLKHLAAAGVRTVCYNFMPVFDWTRTNLEYEWEDGSAALAFDEAEISTEPGTGADSHGDAHTSLHAHSHTKLQADADANSGNPLARATALPGWNGVYTPERLRELLDQYADVTPSRLVENLTYFLRAVMPTAESLGVRMAIHPDDPPWPVFGLPRVVSNQDHLERIVQAYDSPANGLCLCSGSLAADPQNNIYEMARLFGARGRINFAHARNIKVTGHHAFVESGHLSSAGSVDMCEFINALVEVNFEGPIRPDHGRRIWQEPGRPGYGLYDRALGAAYLSGLYEAARRP